MPAESTLTAVEPMTRILVVEDERIVALDIVTTLRRLGYDVVDSVTTGEAAVTVALRTRPHLILMDIRLSGPLDGIAAAEAIVAGIGAPVIFLTAHSDDETLRRAKATQPYSYLVKPFRAPDLRCAIEVTLHRHELDMQLCERERWLRTTLDSLREGVVTADSGERVKYLNPVAESLTGWRTDQAIGRHLREIVHLLSATTGADVDVDSDRLTADDTIVQTMRGESYAVDPSIAAIRDDRGAVLGRVMVLHDVTERRNALREIQRLNSTLEKSVAERTAALQAANRELDAFSYSVAHDLRAPLRAIDGFCQVAIEDFGATLGASGIDVLQRVRDTTKRMRRQIDELLELARLSQCEPQRESVDLSGMANELGGEMRDANHGREVEFIVQPGVQASGDRSLLRAVLSNLLANAWKFTSGCEHPRIEFGARASVSRDHSRELVYFVADNGVGFDMKHADELYGAFKRLHGDQYSGNGVGLAIVDRAVRRMGGRVWAEAKVNEGATFFFTLDG